MRALLKSCDRASKYKEWIDELVDPCTNYYSNQRFIKDIKANLLIIQGGVCAYSEIRLDDINQFRDEDWVDGEFTGNTQFDGALDHFDSRYKKQGRLSWLWDNFFFVHHAINTSKNDIDVYDILKPDRPGYDPEKYLYYDSAEHMFVVSPDITNPVERKQIRHMIDKCVLLNYGRIRRERRKYLNGVFKEFYGGTNKDLSGLTVDQFFTSFEMTKKELIGLQMPSNSENTEVTTS